jgi:hypothetical protein
MAEPFGRHAAHDQLAHDPLARDQRAAGVTRLQEGRHSFMRALRRVDLVTSWFVPPIVVPLLLVLLVALRVLALSWFAMPTG